MFFFFQIFSEGTVDPADIEDLFNQLEDYSDSQPDDNDDTISIGSTPKPSLKPFFCSSRYENMFLFLFFKKNSNKKSKFKNYLFKDFSSLNQSPDPAGKLLKEE